MNTPSSVIPAGTPVREAGVEDKEIKQDTLQPPIDVVPQGMVDAALKLKEEIQTQPTEEQVKDIETRAQKKARLATILDRSVLGDRFRVNLPPDIYGEWVRNDAMEIHRMKTLGFDIDKTYATQNALHGGGDGDSAIVGDVIFMTCDKDTKLLIDEIRQEQFFERNAKSGEKKMLGEEKGYANMVKEQTGGIIPVTIESSVTSPRVGDIKEAIRLADQQTSP